MENGEDFYRVLCFGGIYRLNTVRWTELNPRGHNIKYSTVQAMNLLVSVMLSFESGKKDGL